MSLSGFCTNKDMSLVSEENEAQRCEGINAHSYDITEDDESPEPDALELINGMLKVRRRKRNERRKENLLAYRRGDAEDWGDREDVQE